MRILELEKEVDNEFAKPALLPKENEMFNEYIVSGFGRRAFNLDSQFLRTVNLTDLGWIESCAPDGIPLDGTPDRHICGENLKDIALGPCIGDSGGTSLLYILYFRLINGYHTKNIFNNNWIDL